MSVTSPIQMRASRRLDQAVEYVTRTWFPPNPDIYDSIQRMLADSNARPNVPSLIQEIKKDFSLFTFCLRTIRDRYPDDYGETNPMVFMRQLPYEDLKQILSVPRSEMSIHDYESMEKLQSLRLKHLVLSVSTAEILALKNKVNPDDAYSVAVLRQLGINLIAWNYPSIYLRALESLKTDNDSELDEVLTEQLGFSPQELGAELTLPTRMRDRMAADLGLTSPHEGSGTPISLTRKICEIGEAFAVLNDPDHFPTGTARSKTVVAEINQALGPNGLTLIREIVNRKYASYVERTPELFRVNTAIEENLEKASRHFGAMLLMKNTYVPRLPPAVQQRIREVYGTLVKGQVSTEGIQMLAFEILPEIGFVRGAIFLIEQRSMLLVPRLRIGDDSLSRYRRVDCMEGAQGGNPITDAFFCSYPIKQEGPIINGEPASFIVGGLGTSERVGVLYMELSDALENNTAMDSLMLFKAFRHCFADCLGLK